MKTPRRIVLTTFGSLGDLHPFIALALELQARGHQATIATTRHYRQRIESRGIGFSAVRPDDPDPQLNDATLRHIMDRRHGSEYVIRRLMMPAIRESYEDLIAAAEGADLLVGHVLTYAARLVAEKKRIPWATTFLQPLGFFSAYDPPVLPQVPFLARLRFLGRAFHQPLFALAKRSCRSWSEPWHHLRSEVGLPPTSDNPLFEGLYSPSLVLAMFSPLFADKQPDWPPQTVLTGFPFLEDENTPDLPSALLRYLDGGPPPMVFTLGSSGIPYASAFFEQSAAAARLLGMRGVLVIGADTAYRPASLPDGVVAFDYVPFAELFRRSAAIVHAGGIGTTALAMRSGRPMLVMPCAHDQFDNAARVARLGVGRTIAQRRYQSKHVATELRRLLDDAESARRASAAAEMLRRENGVRVACDAIEKLF